MSKKRSSRASVAAASTRRAFTGEYKREAVQMLLDGHTTSSVASRLGLSGTNMLYRWKREQLEHSGPVATSLEARVRELFIGKGTPAFVVQILPQIGPRTVKFSRGMPGTQFSEQFFLLIYDQEHPPVPRLSQIHPPAPLSARRFRE